MDISSIKRTLNIKAKDLDKEEKAILNKLNCLGTSRAERSIFFDKLVDVKCLKTELKKKIKFFEELEKSVKK